MVGINGLQLDSNLFTSCNFGPMGNFVKWPIGINSSNFQFQIKFLNYFTSFNIYYIHRIRSLCLIVGRIKMGGPIVIFFYFWMLNLFSNYMKLHWNVSTDIKLIGRPSGIFQWWTWYSIIVPSLLVFQFCCPHSS